MLGNYLHKYDPDQPTSANKRSLLNRHGCYCYPPTDLNKKIHNVGPINNYLGPPVDELDRLCKKYWVAIHCLPEACQTPEFYNAAIAWSWNSFDQSAVCEDSDPCLQQYCELEIDFTEKVAMLMTLKGYVRDVAGPLTTWDEARYAEVCPATVRDPNETDHGGKNACCGNGIDKRGYNDIAFQCCDDGTIQPYGSDC